MASYLRSATLALVVACLVCAISARNPDASQTRSDGGVDKRSIENLAKSLPIGPEENRAIHAHDNSKRSAGNAPHHQAAKSNSKRSANNAQQHQAANRMRSPALPRNAANALPGWDTGIGMLGR